MSDVKRGGRGAADRSRSLAALVMTKAKSGSLATLVMTKAKSGSLATLVMTKVKSGSLAALVMTMGALVLLLGAMGCNSSLTKIDSAPLAGDWRDFQGTWTAAGSRKIMRLGDGRRASISDLTGSLLLTGTSKPSVGFRAEAIVFNDSTAGITGRAVWTDERGEQVFSELRSEPQSNAVLGTFIGGTGRYAGATGTYEFAWRFLLEQEDGTVQGQADDLKGRVRVSSPQSGTGGPQS